MTNNLPDVIVDKDGDRWRRDEDGTYGLLPSSAHPTHQGWDAVRVEEEFGPLAVPWSPPATESPAPLTADEARRIAREEIRELLTRMYAQSGSQTTDDDFYEVRYRFYTPE